MSEKKENGGSAFPRAGSEDRTGGDMPDGNVYDKPLLGMSLRDYFAGMAMQGLIQRWATPRADERKVWDRTMLVEICFEFADAMIAARKAKP